MDLATIEITPEQAAEELEYYRKLMDEERSVEDDALMAAYRAAKRGLPVISLTRAFNIAGQFDDGLPKLAIVRADSTRVFVKPEWAHPNDTRTYVFYDHDRRPANRGSLVNRTSVRVTMEDKFPKMHRWSGTTIVPSIPPRYRPKPSRLRNCHLLWEVEKWTLVPPVDPALIKHIRGDLWSVLAVYDLTPLERAVLSQRAHA